MSSYNLTDNVNETFEFTISGVVYKMRYPLVSELETLKDLVDKNEKLEKEAKEANQPWENNEVRDYMYSFISPKETGEPIGEFLEKQNIRVMINFNNMVKSEFGLTQ